MAHLCRCSFLSLLLFILTCSPSLAQPYPDPHYTPPLCNSSFPALLPSFITAQQILCKTQRYDDCTPASNATLIPALYAPEVSSYTAVLLKRNPSDRSTLRFTLTVPGAQGGSSWNASEYVFARYYDQNQAAPSSSGGPESYWAQWSAGSNPLNQFPIEIFADGEGSGPAYAGNKEFRTTVQVALVTGRPGASSNGSGYACMIVVEVIATCCGDIQPPVLVEQPYWILLLSTVAFFFASYLWLLCVMGLEKFAWFNRARAAWARARARGRGKKQSSSPKRGGGQESLGMTHPLIVEAEAGSESAAEADKKQQGEGDQEDEDEDIDDVPSKDLSMSARLARANGSYLLFQFLLVLINLFYLVLRFCVLDNSSADRTQSAWWRYEQVYMFHMNSSSVTLLASAWASHLLIKYEKYKTKQARGTLTTMKPKPKGEKDAEEEEGDERKGRCGSTFSCCFLLCLRTLWSHWAAFYSVSLPRSSLHTRRICLALLALYAPALLTHVLPMWVLFFPVLLVAFLVFLGLVLLLGALMQLTQRTGESTLEKIKSAYREKRGTAGTRTETQQLETYQQGSSDASSSSSPPPSAFSTSSPPRLSISYPWYSSLLLRLMCTICVVVFLQTSFNLAVIVYGQWVPQWGAATPSGEKFAQNIWANSLIAEYEGRGTDQWREAMEQSLHQMLMQISLFV